MSLRQKCFRRFRFLPAILFIVSASAAEPHWKFDFGPGPVQSGYTQVLSTCVYSRANGFGFEPGAHVSDVDRQRGNDLKRDFCTSTAPFYFSVAVPEGNYRVTVTLGDRQDGSTNTIKVELRRLMIQNVITRPGKFSQQTFMVNIRTPKIDSTRAVKLKERERTSEIWAWDEKLTLEFNGARPCICAVEIESATKVPTVFLLGDSTVCDQPSEPWNSWGQMLTRFFKPTLAIANHAESGETLKNSIAAGRLEKVLSLMRPGDYLFIQYGHNDMKDRSTNALANYKSNLKRFVNSTREKGGIPVLITSMERKAGVDHETLGAYPDTVRTVAREENVPLIDLNAMSKVLYRALGTHLDQAFQDGTHHNNYGSYELAQCVVKGIKDLKLPLAKHLSKDFKSFDPRHPDPIENFNIPASPGARGEKPLGD
ncbi:MAG TPA: rhamnogalacturonan acetylesterase [Verrucomicrobiae bacterium]|nr:rhamnogalacturonan acetylesterase [Verrucomicrobiae bacterium]